MKKKTSEKTGRAPKIKGKNFRLVIPNLTQYSLSNSSQISQLKSEVLLFLEKNQKSRNLRYYSIAVQSHQNSVPHLDILLVYDKSVQTSLNRFDKLIKHGNLTKYKELNTAILEYNFKQDKNPLSNLPPDITKILDIQQLKKDPYRYLELQMLKDPLHFNVEQYVRQHDLAQYITSWSSIKIKLKDMQMAAANLLLKSKPGIRFITEELIHATFTPFQLKTYYSSPFYAQIIDRINCISLHPNHSPQTSNKLHTKHLFINSKASGVGKTSLVEADLLNDPTCMFPGLGSYYSVYHFNAAQTYFPPYRPFVYNMVFWDQFTIDSLAFPKKRYNLLLSYLGGSQINLPIKNTHSVLRSDNPLHILTSNYTLEQLICKTFSSQQSRVKARSNLRARIQEVTILEQQSIHFLRKLFQIKD